MAKRPDAKVLDDYRKEHLPYEWDMLAGTYDGLGRDRGQILDYALIESFCVHARNLIQFYRGTGRKDYIKAKHFTKDGTYKPKYVGDPTGEIGRDLYGKLNQQITHMTEDRTTVQSKKIGPEERDTIFEALRKEEARFRPLMEPPMPETIRIAGSGSDASATNAITTTSVRSLGDA